MTVNTTTSFTTWQGNGSATSFDFSFDMGIASYAVVYRTLISSGLQTLIPLGSYGLTLGASAGGTLTYPLSGAALSSLYTITLQRSVPITQDVNLINQAAFYPEVIEAEFDKLTMIDQQLNDFWNGLTPPPPNYVGQTVQFGSVAALRANAVVPTVSGQQALLRGYYAAGIGKGGGTVWFDSSDTTTADNGGSVFVDAIGQRWKRVFDGVTDPFMWGAVADVETSSTDGHITVTGTNALPAFQAMFTHAKANTLAMHIPAGKWRLASTWTLDYTGETAIWYNLRPRLYGDGSRATILFFDAGASDGLVIAGTSANAPTANSPMIIEGMQIVKVPAGLPLLGVGLTLQDHAYSQLSDVIVWQWSTGVYLIDLQQAEFDSLSGGFNDHGMIVVRGDVTQPNCLTFRSGGFFNSFVYGVDFINVGELSWIGGAFVGNGPSHTDVAQFGVKLSYETGVIESGVSATFIGCRFEGNGGLGDLEYSNGLFPMTLNLIGNSFNKDLDRYGKNMIHFTVATGPAGGLTYVTMQGNSFKSYNAYVPSGTRPYLDADDKSKVFVSEPGINYWQDILEKPNLKTWGRGAGMGMKPSSWAVMSNDTTGITDSGNCFGITHSGTGIYGVTFVTTMSGSYAVSALPIATADRIPNVTAITATDFTIEWKTAAGVLSDTRFTYMTVGGLDITGA